MTFAPVHDASGNAVAPTRTSMRQWAQDHISLECARCRGPVEFRDRFKTGTCDQPENRCAGLANEPRPADPHSAKLWRQWRAWLHSDQYNGAANTYADESARPSRHSNKRRQAA